MHCLQNINKLQSKYVFSNFHSHKMHVLALLGLSTPEMTDFPTLQVHLPPLVKSSPVHIPGPSYTKLG